MKNLGARFETCTAIAVKDRCSGPRCAVAVLFLRILFPRRMLSTRITSFKHPRGDDSLFVPLPRLERNKRNHFVPNDAIDLSIRSHLRRSLFCRSSCEAHVVLSLILRHEPRDYPHEATTETNRRAAEKRRRCEALTEPLVNHRGVVRIMRRSLYSLSLSLSSPVSRLPSPISCSQPLSHPSLYTPSTLFPSVFLFYSFIPFLSRSPLPVFVLFHLLYFSHA